VNKYKISDPFCYKAMLLLLFVVMIHCAYASRHMPSMKPMGADFHNLYVFHNCEYAETPYLTPGELCGDVLRRPIVYPPLFYWSYFWTKGWNYEAGYFFLVAQIILAMLAVFFLLSRIDRSRRSDASAKTWVIESFFWLLLLGSLPFVSAVERGNTDVFVVLAWMLAALCFVNKWYFFWGSLVALAVLFKIYPLVAGATLAVGYLLSFVLLKDKNIRPVYKASLGCLSVLCAVMFFWYGAYRVYFLDVLPEVRKLYFEIDMFSHALGELDNFIPYLSLAMKAGLSLSWMVFVALRLRVDPALAFSGCLAISTFFGNISFEYNLITVFPLLFLLLARSRNCFELFVVLLGVICFLGDRLLWREIFSDEWRVISEVIWLMGLPALCLFFPGCYEAPIANQAAIIDKKQKFIP
jgi:hypothetical protein